MTRIYIASSFKLIDRIEHVYETLTDAGHTIPDVWWDDDQAEIQADLKQLDGIPDEDWYEKDVVVRRALDHWENIRSCDVFVLVAPKDRTKKYNGANLELGYAFAHGLDAFCVGRLERSAMYIGPSGDPVTQVGSAEALEKILENYEDTPAKLSELEVQYGSACADCGRKAPVYGPIDFDGQKMEPGDYCCEPCAIDRGVRKVTLDG